MSSHDGEAGPPDANRLVFAMCHEISNLVAAVRLQAHLLDESLSPRELAMASLEVDDLSARASALLALIKPVLTADSGRKSGRVSGDVVMHGVERVVEDYGIGGVKVSFHAPPELPALALDPDVVHHLLLAQIFCAMEDAHPGEHVRVRAEPREAEVVFAIEDSAALEEEHLRWQQASLRGRALCCAIAQHILLSYGGRIEVHRDGDGSRTEFFAPRAPA